MSYSDLRKGRFSEANRAYFITTVVAGRRPLFADFRAARMLVAEAHRLHEEERLLSLAWVVMPDHFHWLFQLPEESDLGRVIGTFKGSSSRKINRHFALDGPLWQPAFYDHAVRADEDIAHIARYIVANPLRAGIVKNLGEYPHWDATWML
jgi:REP element-mobilizing transposase RayT